MSTHSGVGQGRLGQTQPHAAGTERAAASDGPRRSAFWVEPELHRLVAAMARRNGRTIMGQITLIVEEALRREAEQSRRASDRQPRRGAQRHEGSAAERAGERSAAVPPQGARREAGVA